jgi:hypothetical protein
MVGGVSPYPWGTLQLIFFPFYKGTAKIKSSKFFSLDGDDAP